MFELFKKKSPLEKLEIKYRKLLKEAYVLSATNRKLSDMKIAESEEVIRLMDLIKKEK